MIYQYKTHGTCSRKITVELDGRTIRHISFEGGCAGNTAGISKLVEGMDIDRVIQTFSGIRCGLRSTSCPDQLARAVREAYEAQQALQAE